MPLSARPVESDDLDNVLRFAPRPKRSRLGLAHKIAAVAAVSGLALAAAAPSQEAEELSSAKPARRPVGVADVRAPATDTITIDRASVTSKFIKEEKLATVMTAAGGDVTKKAKPATATTAAGGKATSLAAGGALAQPVDNIRLTSRFGHRKNPTGPGYMNHNGLDYAVPMRNARSRPAPPAPWCSPNGPGTRATASRSTTATGCTPATTTTRPSR